MSSLSPARRKQRPGFWGGQGHSSRCSRSPPSPKWDLLPASDAPRPPHPPKRLCRKLSAMTLCKEQR